MVLCRSFLWNIESYFYSRLYVTFSSIQNFKINYKRLLILPRELNKFYFLQDTLDNKNKNNMLPAVLPLDGTVLIERVTEPVVWRPSCLELFGAERMGNVFQRIVETMCEVVGRVDAPEQLCLRMLFLNNYFNGWHYGRCSVLLRFCI